jgi:hypothetical protein
LLIVLCPINSHIVIHKQKRLSYSPSLRCLSTKKELLFPVAQNKG